MSMLWIMAGIIAGFYMAWNIGTNDAGALGASVGSGALHLRQAVLIAAVLSLLGAITLGHKVMSTIGEKIVPGMFVSPSGAFAAVVAAGLWVTFCSWRRLPISTTQSIVGAMVGYGLILQLQGITSIDWMMMRNIMISWVASPIAGAVGAFVIYRLVTHFLIRRAVGVDQRDRLENFFGHLQVGTACYVAFALGTNAVANATGVMMAVFPSPTGTFLLKLVGGVGIAIGVSVWGYRVIRTVGEEITDLTPTRGFSAEFATASVVLFFTQCHMPVSTTQTLVGGVVGVGFARGIHAIQLDVVKNIVFSWVVTVPAAAFIAMGVYGLFTVLL